MLIDLNYREGFRFTQKFEVNKKKVLSHIIFKNKIKTDLPCNVLSEVAGT